MWDNGDLIEPSSGYSSVTVSTKPITKVKAGKTYKYKTVAVNAKGQQGKASGTATAKVKQHKLADRQTAVRARLSETDLATRDRSATRPRGSSSFDELRGPGAGWGSASGSHHEEAPMPTRTTRPTRTPSARRSSRPRRATGTSASRRGAPARRGLAGGWLQRRQPEPSGLKKAMSTARRALPHSKGSIAAAGLALVGAAGVALRKRGGEDGAHDHAPTTRTSPPVSGPPTPTVTTPPNTSAHTTSPPTPPAA